MTWDPTKHPRHPAGSSKGGEFKTFYTASITFRVRDKDGNLKTKTISQDVTDDVAEGGREEELADRLYWKEARTTEGFFDILSGGVSSERRRVGGLLTRLPQSKALTIPPKFKPKP